MYACVAQEAAQMLVLFSAVIGWVNRGRSRLQTELYSFVLHKKINWNVPHPKRTINPMCSSCQATVSLWCFYLQKWGWLARLVSILGTLLVAISLLPLSSVFHNLRILCLYLPLDSHLRSTDSHSHPRKTELTNQHVARVCCGGPNILKGGQILP